jgi:hypothetical protein
VTGNKGTLQELIQADLDGELTVGERAELARLLLQDPEARRLKDEFRKTDQLLRDVAAAEPPPGLRDAILAGGPARSARQASSGFRHYGWPAYRVAAVILGGLLVVGISYLARDGSVPVRSLQGSLGAPQDQWSMRAEGIEVNASLLRTGDSLRLELNSSTTIPFELIARVDPATTAFVGKTGDAPVSAANGEVAVQPAIGNQANTLVFSGAAPIRLELRSSGRLLGEGTLSARNP